MKNAISVIWLGLILLLYTGCNDQSKTAEKSTNKSSQKSVSDEPSAENSTSEETKEILIDVRSQEEWDSGHLDQAVHIPHEEITEKIASVTEDKSAKLVLY